MTSTNNILSLIGRTPLVDTNHPNAKVLAKLEYFSAGNSIKDRVALRMIENAEKQGLITPRITTIIEATSGNLGVGLAMVCSVKGYKFIAVMSDRMSPEYRKIIEIYGAEIVLVDGNLGMKGAMDVAENLSKEMPNSFYTKQFENQANVEAHYYGTAEEIWKDTNGQIDFFVAGVGTGGTITGVGKRLKELNPNIKVIAVEPEKSPVLSGGQAGLHRIQGIGSGFVPPLLDIKLIDSIIQVSDEAAILTAQENVKNLGILGGISSGAASWAANKIADENRGKTIVFILASSGERQLSSDLFKK